MATTNKGGHYTLAKDETEGNYFCVIKKNENNSSSRTFMIKHKKGEENIFTPDFISGKKKSD